MLIVIAGAGRVGLGVAEALIKEQKNDVVLVDSSSRAVKNAQAFDMLVLHGNVLDRATMIEAGIERADVFIAATDIDDRNVLACGLAKHLRHRRTGDQEALTTICRIRDEHILDEQAHGTGRALDDLHGRIDVVGVEVRHLRLSDLPYLLAGHRTDLLLVRLRGALLEPSGLTQQHGGRRAVPRGAARSRGAASRASYACRRSC